MTSSAPQAAQIVRSISVELNNLGVLLHNGNRRDQAAGLYMNALQALKESVGPDMIADCHGMLGGDDEVSERWRHTLRCHREAVAHHIQVDGDLPRQQASPESGSEHHRDSDSKLLLAIPIDVNETDVDDDEVLSAFIIHNMGLLHLQEGVMFKAEPLLEMALSWMPEADEDSGIVENKAVFVSAHFALGLVYAEQDREEESLEMLMGMLSIQGDDTRSNASICVTALNRVGHMLMARGHVTDALAAFDAASYIYHQQAMQAVTAEESNAQDAAAAPAA